MRSRQTDRANQCDGKRRYPTRRIARAARRHIPNSGPGHLSVYRCPWCDTFHIGHNTPDPAVEDMRARQEAAQLAALDLDLVTAEASARVLGITVDEALDLLKRTPA